MFSDSSITEKGFNYMYDLG